MPKNCFVNKLDGGEQEQILSTEILPFFGTCKILQPKLSSPLPAVQRRQWEVSLLDTVLRQQSNPLRTT